MGENPKGSGFPVMIWLARRVRFVASGVALQQDHLFHHQKVSMGYLMPSRGLKTIMRGFTASLTLNWKMKWPLLKKGCGNGLGSN
jgi:hypothetical protein